MPVRHLRDYSPLQVMKPPAYVTHAYGMLKELFPITCLRNYFPLQAIKPMAYATLKELFPTIDNKTPSLCNLYLRDMEGTFSASQVMKPPAYVAYTYVVLNRLFPIPRNEAFSLCLRGT